MIANAMPETVKTCSSCGEPVPQAVEVSVEPVVVAVAKKVRLLPLSLCLRALGLFDPALTGSHQVQLDHASAKPRRKS